MTRDDVVTLARSYPASAEQIWKAWTDPDILARWYGCRPDQLWTIHEWDVRVAGRLRVSMMFGDTPYEVVGAFERVEPPHRLRYTFGPGQTITMRIAPDGDRCTVTVTHEGLATADLRGIVTAGWTSSLTQLAGAP